MFNREDKRAERIKYVENLSRVFLYEWPPYNLWVIRVYIVWVKGKKVTLNKPPGRMFHDYLAGRPYL